MCGIAGVVFDEAQEKDAVNSVVSAMCAAQAQRGPDGKFTWTDGRVGLGMVRLAIVGTEARGRQPFENGAGDRLVFNGELYQPRQVMASLGGEFSDGECDGAVLLELLQQRGLEGLNGVSAMFGLALFQIEDQSVLLARDAWGQKPLYRTRMKNGWAFASTIAALHAVAGPLRVRPEAMHECLIFKSVGGYGSAFAQVEQVPAGGWLRIGRDGSLKQGRWLRSPTLQPISPDPDEVRELVSAAIRMRTSSEFRASIFLSGGLDSSIVASAAVDCDEHPKPHVLTIGYDIGSWQDEHALAVRLADELGLQHQALRLAAEDVPELLRDTAIALEDPNHDPVVVPTLVLTRCAARETKVVLTGDGSDEFWGGYSRFDNPPDRLDDYLLRTMVFHPHEVGLDSIPASYLRGIDLSPADSMPVLDRIMRLEVANRLRNYHLARVDKLSMAVGLEVRSPFLDLAVTMFAESIPADAKRPAGRPKGLLIDAFQPLLPKWLLERRKQPFTVPIEGWLAGPLGDFAHDMLDSPNAFVRQFADPTPMLASLADRFPDTSQATKIWSLLHLEIWYREFATRMERMP